MKITKILVAILIFGSLVSCKKSAKTGNPPPTDTTKLPPLVDPPIANTIGFFLNDWASVMFTTPAYTDTSFTSSPRTTIAINPGSIITKVPKSIFGNNANPYMTQMVTEPGLLNHIKNLQPHIIRFPGGNLSSVFFWNAVKGADPADAPSSLIDAEGKVIAPGYWYGKNAESWTLSVDNYYSMLQQTGTQGMITINYAYARYGTGNDPVAAAAHLAADWVRYDNGRTKYWEIGNESNGTWQAGYRIDVSKNKDGQPEIITGALYGKHFNVFADSMKKAAMQIGKTIYIGSQLLQEEPASWATATDKSWNQGVLGASADKPDFYIIHSYYTPYQQNSSASVILNSAITETKKMMDHIKTSTANNGSQIKPVALTEWNIFAEGSMQMVSNINGMHAVLVLGEVLKNQFGMASRWDLANSWSSGNDHGMFNNGDEPGVPRWNPRPAFYHMYFFQKMFGDRLVSSTVTGNADIIAYASSFSDGRAGVIVINKGNAAEPIGLNFQNFTMGDRLYMYVLSGGNDNGEFSIKVFINGNGPSYASGGPVNYNTLKAYSAATRDGIKLSIPGRSVIYMVIDKK